MTSGDKISGTCQACFGSFALKGLSKGDRPEMRERMVLHGYERPGLGYTVGRCWGVDKKPYELDVEVTKAWRQEVCEVILPRLEKGYLAVETATELMIQVPDYSEGSGWGTKRRQVMVSFKQGVKPEGSAYRAHETFEAAQKTQLWRIEGNIEQAEHLLKELDRRIKDWVYAPEKLVTEARKGPLVHESRGGNRSWAAVCQMSYRSYINLQTTQDPAKVTCPKCIARRK